MSKSKEITKKGFRQTIHCGENVERIEVRIYSKKKAFRKQKIDFYGLTRGYYPLKITIEDSPMWKE
jgi:hypothetical protein